MKSFNWKQMATIAGIALVVVYASNNEIPVIGDKLQKAMNGGTGWF